MEHLWIFATFNNFFTLCNYLGKAGRSQKFDILAILIVDANNPINGVNFRVLSIPVQWETVADFCCIHKLRNSSESKKGVLLVAVVLVQDIANRADGSSVLI